MAAAFARGAGRARLGTQELLRRLEPGLEPRRPRPLQPRREPQGRRGAVRVPRHLHLAACPPTGKAQHLPLGQALREYAGEAKTERLLSLLLPVQRAAEACAWLRALVDSGEIFHPLRFTPREAFQLLGDVPRLEAAGVVVRMPASWTSQRPPRPRVTATVGRKAPSGVGAEALLDFRIEVALDGEPLDREEIARLLRERRTGLALVRGRWVEVDPGRLQRTLERAARASSSRPRTAGVSFAEALRMLAGAASGRGRRRRRGGRRVVASRGRTRGSPRRSRACATRTASRAWIRETRCARRSARTSRPACAGSTSCPARPRRLPRRRHGPRQDDPGAGAPAGAEARRARGGGGRACWWRPRRSSPTGSPRRSASPRACGCCVAHPSALPAGGAEGARRASGSPASTSWSRATARCCACRGSRARRWTSSCSTRRRRSRTPARGRPARPRRSPAARASPSPARPSRTASSTCGRSSTS